MALRTVADHYYRAPGRDFPDESDFHKQGWLQDHDQWDDNLQGLSFLALVEHGPVFGKSPNDL